jgi:starch phosphorylase
MQHDENSEFQHSGDLVEQLRRYAFAGVPLAGQHTAFYERHLKFDNVMAPTAAGAMERFEAFARSIRDLLADRWLRTEETYRELDPKRVYYCRWNF